MINKLFLLLYIFFNVESIVTRGGQKTEIRPKPVLPLSKTDKRAGLYGSSGPRVNIFSFMWVYMGGLGCPKWNQWKLKPDRLAIHISIFLQIP